MTLGGWHSPRNSSVFNTSNDSGKIPSLCTRTAHSGDDEAPALEPSHPSTPFVCESEMHRLHRLLWMYQEEISVHFSASPAYANLNRRVMTLLAQVPYVLLISSLHNSAPSVLHPIDHISLDLS